MSTTVTAYASPETARDIIDGSVGRSRLGRDDIEWVANHPHYITKIHCPTAAMAADLRAAFRRDGYRVR